MHVMIDLETLGTEPNSALLEIGAVAFEKRSGGKVLDGKKAFSRPVMVGTDFGTIDHGTLVFWMDECRKSSDMADKLRNAAVPLPQALVELAQWPEVAELGFKWEDVEGVWAKGPGFDLANLTTKYRKIGYNPPWHYRKERCVRTFLDMMGISSKDLSIDASNFKDHDAVDDCIWQVTEMQMAMQIRGGVGGH